MDIETAATTAIKEKIANTDRLSQYINERDKEPIWDGSIYVYKNESRKSDNFIGRIPVQVKGKMVKSNILEKDKIKYSVPTRNLEKYRDEGGVIYFVVYVSENAKKRIYYASLLPYILNKYINNAHGKEVSIILKRLPEESHDFENLVNNFINDRKKQRTVQDGRNKSINEIAKLLGKDNIKLTINYMDIGNYELDPISSLMNNETYMYMENKDESISFPIQRYDGMDMVSYERDVNVYANRKKYFDKIKIERYINNKIVICMGTSFKFIGSDGKATLKYELNGNLDEQIKSMQFILDVVADGGLYIFNKKCTIEQMKYGQNDFYKEAVEKKLEYFLMIKMTLDKLGIREPLEIEKVTEKQEGYVEMLINSILKGERIGFKDKKQIPLLSVVSIGNLNIILLFKQMEDKRYEVKDFFRYKFECMLDKEENYDTTQFCILRTDDYLKASNIDISIVEKAFMEHNNKGHYERMVLCILEMIKAYDKRTIRIEFLETAANLSKWLTEKEPDNLIHYINLYQCYRRQRKLTDDEKNKLCRILEEDGINDSIKAAAYILLDSKQLADMYIDKLDNKEIKTFVDFPIYYLYEKLR